MVNQLVERGYLTQSLGSASHSGEHGFKAVPGLLKLVLENRAWEKRIIVETGEEFPGFYNFEAYINANPPKGLGASIETIDRLIGKDETLRATFYEALERHVGKPQMEHKSDNLEICVTHDPKTVPYQKHYDHGQWRPCLIIDGPDSDGYTGHRIVLDAPRALKLIEFLQQHKSVFEAMAEQDDYWNERTKEMQYRSTLQTP